MKLNSFYCSIFSFTLIVSNFLNVGEDNRFVTIRSIALTSGLTLQALLSKVDAKSPWLLGTHSHLVPFAAMAFPVFFSKGTSPATSECFPICLVVKLHSEHSVLSLLVLLVPELSRLARPVLSCSSYSWTSFGFSSPFCS